MGNVKHGTETYKADDLFPAQRDFEHAVLAAYFIRKGASAPWICRTDTFNVHDFMKVIA
ncbi:MAG: hypothetical protein GTO08_03565 [Deltaproteobacteria bacterium]|nr:hypothetical protein [Deltaproteobacteria bacterium]